MTAVLNRQFAAVERTLVAAVAETEGKPFGAQVQRFLRAGSSELGRIGAVVYQRLDQLFHDGHRRGLLSAPPELLGEITRGAVERLLNSQLPRELDCSAADLLGTTVDTVLYEAIRPGIEHEKGS
ncbi:hypothetical protein ACIHDR_44665 [Nocardia sp. NPDC052278]|uniref:hypothetical protein n=1 Tax=unclassified Nocardia TaxID=2637762 RepID=UPI0036BA8488